MKHSNYNKDKHGELQTFEDHQINFSNVQPPKDIFIRSIFEPNSSKIPDNIVIDPSNKANKILGVSTDNLQLQTTTSTNTTIAVSKFKRDKKKLTKKTNKWDFITNKKKVGVVAENDDDDDTSSLSDTSSLDVIPMRRK